MASASVRITRFDTEAERDAIENWEEGDMAYVVADQWRLPKATFHKFCYQKRFWPAWAIEVARTRGERIRETPTEYILTVG